MSVLLSSPSQPCPLCQGAGTWVECLPHGGGCDCRGHLARCEACDGTGDAHCLACGTPYGVDAEGDLIFDCARCDADAQPFTHPE